MKDESNPQVIVERSGNGLTPFLIGMAVGAGLALLFAPQSGAETRRSIARGARKVRDSARDAAEGISEKVGDTIDAARERVSDGIETARDAVAARRGQVKRAMNAGRAAAAQAREDLERRLAETKAAYEAGARVAHESSTRDD